MRISGVSPRSVTNERDRDDIMFESLAARIRNARTVERTARELNRLSDRQLVDIGLARGSIQDVARAATL
jgi:uncharacterized protein YjiS (DUF1127 family)